MVKYFMAAILLSLMAGCSPRAVKSPDGRARSEKLIVASQMVDCVAVGVRRCLVVKPEHTYDWELFYNWIEGFEYEPGYEYVLSVYKVDTDNPPADGSNISYFLDRVISKEKKDSKNIPDTSHIIEAYRERGID